VISKNGQNDKIGLNWLVFVFACWLMRVFLFLALFIAFFGLVVADHATPDDDDEIPSG